MNHCASLQDVNNFQEDHLHQETRQSTPLSMLHSMPSNTTMYPMILTIPAPGNLIHRETFRKPR